MGGLDGIINPIPEDEKLREAIFNLLDKILVMYYFQITDDGKPLEESFEELKRKVKEYEMKIITGDGLYDINLNKYVEERGLGGILRQFSNLGKPYSIIQLRYKDNDFIGFVIYEGKYLDSLLKEINRKYGLEDKIIDFIILLKTESSQ